jgi:poly-gamma-glutamate synthesis protein (capsule biosynthesis protein)
LSVALAAAWASAAGAVPQVVSEVPEWVAPGAEVQLRVRGDADGTLTLERRVPGGLRRIAERPVVAGRVVELPYRPEDSGAHRLQLRIDDRAPRAVSIRVRPLSLVALGDVSPGSAIAAVRAYGPAWHWQKVGPWLREQDIVVANWETATGPAGAPWPGKAFNFLAPPETLRAAAEVGGVDAMSLANNHALDYGRGPFLRGIRAMRAAGIAPFGGGIDLDGALEPAIITRGGLRVAFVGFNAILPSAFWATPSGAGNAPPTTAAITQSIRRARAQADLVVAYPHWGIELDRRPSEAQRAMAATAFAAGADVVIGAHPHVPQPIERRGRGLVAWSLGNFVFSPGSAAGTRSIALRMTLAADGVRGWTTRGVAIRGTRPVFTTGR